MKLLCGILTALTVLAMTPELSAGGKKSNKASVTFHLETEGTDNPKMIFPQMTNGQTRYFRRSPEITLLDMVSFSPFPADNGEGLGLIFKLKPNAANRLAAITSANLGRWFISQVNGRGVDAVMIDKPVTDGVIVIWKGASEADVAILDKKLPRIGAENKKK
jgi:hypothetical protein